MDLITKKLFQSLYLKKKPTYSYLSQVREYTGGGRVRIRFYFLTRSYSTYMKDAVFNDIKKQTIKPDIILMNSCLWDLSR